MRRHWIKTTAIVVAAIVLVRCSADDEPSNNLDRPNGGGTSISEEEAPEVGGGEPLPPAPTAIEANGPLTQQAPAQANLLSRWVTAPATPGWTVEGEIVIDQLGNVLGPDAAIVEAGDVLNGQSCAVQAAVRAVGPNGEIVTPTSVQFVPTNNRPKPTPGRPFQGEGSTLRSELAGQGYGATTPNVGIGNVGFTYMGVQATFDINGQQTVGYSYQVGIEVASHPETGVPVLRMQIEDQMGQLPDNMGDGFAYIDCNPAETLAAGPVSPRSTGTVGYGDGGFVGR